MRPETIENPLIRRWTCPDDEVIAAYVDGGLRENKKARVEFHLAKCERCRLTVAEVVKLHREIELPVPPFEIARKTMEFAPKVSARSRWILAPAAAMVLIVLITITITLLREPQKLMVMSPPPPSAPLIAKAEPIPSNHARVQGVLRKPQFPEVLPIIISPLQNSTVTRDQFDFRWKPVSRSSYYEISVVTSDGDLLWEGQTKASVLRLPSDVMLKGGSYFVWVTAHLANGQVAKSSPVRFLIKR